ncbi:MAG TPA: 6,7-dimethyl-8-ribityllumazine synthase [Gammaproteobacteria bacterium]|jgi:6,7-dimethyl-8-ribityllumazine synthase|nr:6,7-dimethyl-8-ribityllumazine synthase [Gammaproteobacteria bacterium]
MQFAIVVSEYNANITEKLLAGALSRLKSKGINENAIVITKVPGAVEIPLTAQRLAKTKKYQAIICLGAVIRGDTDHYDYVCQQVSYGCQRVMLDFDTPVIFGILTTHTEEQAEDRVGGTGGHKGEEAADAALQMVTLKDLI